MIASASLSAMRSGRASVCPHVPCVPPIEIPLAGGVQLLSANAVLLPCQGVMASPGLVPGLFLRGVHEGMVGGERSGVIVKKGRL